MKNWKNFYTRLRECANALVCNFDNYNKIRIFAPGNNY